MLSSTLPRKEKGADSKNQATSTAKQLHPNSLAQRAETEHRRGKREGSCEFAEKNQASGGGENQLSFDAVRDTDLMNFLDIEWRRWCLIEGGGEAGSSCCWRRSIN